MQGMENSRKDSLSIAKRPPRVLVVDDDARLRDLLRQFLVNNGLHVTVAENAQQMNRLWLRERFDAVVLDVMMPGEDGFSILRRIRAMKDNTPILMLTAKGEDIDRILGLELGADDYLPKPYNPRELLARLHAIMRRREPVEAPGSPSKGDEVVQFGDFTLDLGTRKLKKGEEEIPLTTGEFAVLKTFARHPRVPLSRDKLMKWHEEESTKLLTVLWTFRFLACARLSKRILLIRVISRLSGVWATSLFRMERAKL